jgi:hypothetical protein
MAAAAQSVAQVAWASVRLLAKSAVVAHMMFHYGGFPTQV